MPTSWYGGSREDAKPFTSDGKAYTGGISSLLSALGSFGS